MVIYWYGYVEDIPVIDNIHITDHFPRKWIFPTGEFASRRGDTTGSRLSFDPCCEDGSTMVKSMASSSDELMGVLFSSM